MPISEREGLVKSPQFPSVSWAHFPDTVASLCPQRGHLLLLQPHLQLMALLAPHLPVFLCAQHVTASSRKTLGTQPTVTVIATLFGNRVFVDMIQFSHSTSRWPLIQWWCPYKRDGQREGRVKVEAEIGGDASASHVVCKIVGLPQRLEGAGMTLPFRCQRQHGPTDTLVQDLHPPQLRENTFL